MPNSDERGGAAMIDAVRQLVEMNNQFYPGAPLSSSMGAATCQRGDRIEAGAQRADLLMYEEKRSQYANQPETKASGN